MSIFKQKGASTVEFAIMLPMLLLLVVLVSEFGIRFYQLNALTKSVQVAARYLSDVSVYPDIALTDAEVKKLVCFGDIGGSGPEILTDCNANLVLDPSPTAASNHITVSAKYPSELPGLPSLNAMMKLFTGSAPDSDFDIMTLQATSVMRFAQ